jgi:SAM-dependent methyltransferase
MIVESQTSRGHPGRPRWRRRLQPVDTALTLARSARRAYGVHPRTCPVCGYAGRFHAYGAPLRFDAKCPSCGSLERHRLLGAWAREHGDVLADADVLHFAPEPCLEALLRPVCREYQSADAFVTRADLRLDIEDIDLPDESYDVVICSHVLEHVHDGRALHELYRIVRHGGTALLLVPIVEGWSETYEDASICDAAGRDLVFGQHDHVRIYGRDFRDRVRNAGFALDEYVAAEPAVSRHALGRGETIFVARRA